jgi:hypothetical protein
MPVRGYLCKALKQLKNIKNKGLKAPCYDDILFQQGVSTPCATTTP